MSVSGVEICRRKSCTRLDAEWSCGLPHAMEVRSVTVEDLDEYQQQGRRRTSEFDDAPFAVHSREIRTMWTEPDASDVQVRGRTYMDDQEKVPAGKAMGLLHVDLWNVLAYCRDTFPESRVFIVNIELPNADNLSLVFYWLLPPQNPGRTSAAAFHRLLDRFCDESDDEFRNNRFKLIPNLVDGPNYFGLDLDVASSTTAQYIGAMCQSWASYLQMHLYLTIQGENEDELQERILGGVDVSYLNLELATEFS
ncbi:Ribosome functionion factor 1 [Phytophthora cinnamomi]|uniref:Ribosome functionion factor 1 n=1 Tax=Phytophthora cinnamomi TaxID=4785 RepID=UPI00355AA403|nr:Ribosome functionion factor 1 [Phytophthora cinnamomi]